MSPAIVTSRPVCSQSPTCGWPRDTGTNASLQTASSTKSRYTFHTPSMFSCVAINAIHVIVTECASEGGSSVHVRINYDCVRCEYRTLF